MAALGTMDFFGLQEQARRRTALLVVLYGLAVVGMVLVLYVVVGWVAVASMEGGERSASAWQPRRLMVVAAGVLAVIAAGTATKSAQLAAWGGRGVAERLGGRPVQPDTTNLDERRLLNVVEEMSLAAGMPVPRVYLLEMENGINAFAAGFSPRDAVIGITRGALQRLTRDELQGVIGHEFSHILYGDMRLNLRLIGVLHGILLVSLTGQALLRTLRYTRWTGGRRQRDSGGIVLMVLALGATLWIVGWIGAAVASLIRAAVSRQREFLADAASAQFTRNPAGLASALRKIAATSVHGRITAPTAPEAAHLFFVDGIGRSLDRLLATHPPIEERIRRLEPMAEVDSPRRAELREPEPVARSSDGVETEWTASALHTSAASGTHVHARAAVETVGTVTPAGLDWARALLAEVSPPLLEAARDPVGARSLVLGLLLDSKPAIRRHQLEVIAMDPIVEERLRRLEPLLAEVGPESRLALVELAIPALRHLPPDDYTMFRAMLLNVIQADQRIELFEYALARMIERHVDLAFGHVDTAPQRWFRLEPLEVEVRTVLAALAGWGHRDPDLAARAWQRALAELRLRADGSPPVVSLAELDRALNRLREATPAIRRDILGACAVSVAVDEQLEPIEADLLRAIADALDCPMPPLMLAGEPTPRTPGPQASG